MKFYIFYDPKTLQVKGQSTEKKAMEYPYIESEKHYNVLEHIEIKKKKGKEYVKIKVGYWDDPNNIFTRNNN